MRFHPLMRATRLAAAAAMALGWLLALTAAVPAHPVDPLQAALAVSGARWTQTIRAVGFGAAYLETRAGERTRVPVMRYQADADFAVQTGRQRLEGVRGDERPLDIRLTPQGFLRAAAAHVSSMRETPLGLEVSFAVEGRRYVGVLDGRRLVDRVRVVETDGRVSTEIFFRDFERSGPVRYPRHVMEYHGGRLALDVWISRVDATRAAGAGAGLAATSRRSTRR